MSGASLSVSSATILSRYLSRSDRHLPVLVIGATKGLVLRNPGPSLDEPVHDVNSPSSQNRTPEPVILYPLVQRRAEWYVNLDAVVLAGSPDRNADQTCLGTVQRQIHHHRTVGHGEPRVVGPQNLDVRADGIAQPPSQVVGCAEVANQEDRSDGFLGGRDLFPNQLADVSRPRLGLVAPHGRDRDEKLCRDGYGIVQPLLGESKHEVVTQRRDLFFNRLFDVVVLSRTQSVPGYVA